MNKKLKNILNPIWNGIIWGSFHGGIITYIFVVIALFTLYHHHWKFYVGLVCLVVYAANYNQIILKHFKSKEKKKKPLYDLKIP